MFITHGGRLPAETSRFFGRSKEVAAIRNALPVSRLVTLTGPGGVGKTRLALRVAGELPGEFPDGVCLIQLSALRDAGALVHAVAAALGIPLDPDASGVPGAFAGLAGRLASGLSGSRLLLILDTCEHLADACAALVDTVLSGADGPVVLATSRQPLGLPGEVVFRIPPLEVTGDDGGAVALFADRAGAALPGFVVTEDALPKVVSLCRLLDGIPFGIELAALRMRAVGLDDLLARLPGRLRLLAGCRRAAEHQRSVQASVSWSYDLCTSAERLLWVRLSVFSGGFSLAAAEEVCGGGDLAACDVLGTLIGLIEKSVVLRADAAGGDARYRLLEVVREQGAALADAADAAACTARHRDHYLGVARDFAAAFAGAGQVRLVSRLAHDAANLRLALEWSLAAGQLAAGGELAVACLPWWACTGDLAEASLWLSRFSQENPGHHQPRPSRGAAPRRLACWLLAAQGDQAAAGVLQAGDCVTRASAPEAEGGPPYLITGLVARLAAAFESLTRTALDECTDRCAALMNGLPDGERWVRGWAEWVMGVAGWLDGDAAAAERRLRGGLRLLAPFGDDISAAQHLESFAWLAAARGEYRRAGWLQGAADLRWRRLTEHGSVSVPRFGVPLLHAERDRAEHAAKDALGPAGYAAEHRAGVALREKDALQCALGELSAPLARRQPARAAAGAGQDSEAADHTDRWQLLTSREREVAVLVATGMANRNIAASLFVSKRTVDSHIEHILAKLSCTSRVQIAALVVLQGQADRELGPDRPRGD